MPVESQPAVRTSRVGLSIAWSSDTAANRVLNNESSCENCMTCTRIGPVNFYIAQSAYVWKWTLHRTHVILPKCKIRLPSDMRTQIWRICLDAELAHREIGTRSIITYIVALQHMCNGTCENLYSMKNDKRSALPAGLHNHRVNNTRDKTNWIQET